MGNQSIQGNDAEYVFDVLLSAIKRHSGNPDGTLASPKHSLQAVLDLLSSIAGPYAFVLYDAQYHRVLYGRDALGRRSLLIRRYSRTSITLSSICDPTDFENWLEVEANGIYVLDLIASINPSNDADPVIHIPFAADHSESIMTHTLVPHTPLLLRRTRN